MVSNIINRIQSVSLKWKLIFPFLIFAAIGTLALLYIGLNLQQKFIKKEEKKEILNYYYIFQEKIHQKKSQALSLATIIANNQDVKRLFAKGDRQALLDLLLPLHKRLQNDFGVTQLHFHIPPGKSFLRVHKPEKFGDVLSYRNAIMEVMKSREPCIGEASLARGMTGLSIRGIVPVHYEGVLIGTVEVGYPFDWIFLRSMKFTWEPNFAVYEKKSQAVFTLLESSQIKDKMIPLSQAQARLIGETPEIMIAPEKYPDRSVLLGTLTDYRGDIVALVQIDIDRSPIIKRLARAKRLMLIAGISGISIFFILIWMIAGIFIRPVTEIVSMAREIAQGKRDRRLKPRPSDEIGALTNSLNTMLDSLKERRRQIEHYARTLEIKVRERTADLIFSEEKYRTLVENVPLIVYRVLNDGSIEFVNSHFVEKLGYSIDEMVGDKNFWREKICLDNKPQYEILESCWADGKKFQVERVVKSKHGRTLTFIDRALATRDKQGRLKWIDGIMVDITELKRLQERAIRSEEIRVLSEISERFAHEIRNPLATAGGFARRLRDSLPEDTRNRKFAQIIVEEVARLEDMLQTMLSSIKPFTLCISDIDLNKLLRASIKDLSGLIKAKGIDLMESFSQDIPNIQGDEGLLNRAFGNCLKNAITLMPDNERLSISTAGMVDQLLVTIKYGSKGLADEDIEQFFIPRASSRPGSDIKELPLSKIIIHRHGGKIDIFREEKNVIVLRIELPIILPSLKNSRFFEQNI